MPITVDAKGNISFTPDDIPSEVPSNELLTPVVKKPEIADAAISGFTIENVDGIESEDIQESEESAPIGTKVIRTQLLELYGGMTKEDFLMLFFNQEAPRAAEANDESLARMLKEQRMIIEICRIRERVIIEEDAKRETSRSKAARAERRKLDAEYKPQTKIQKSQIEEQQNQANKEKSQKDKSIETLMNALGIDRDEAEVIYAKKKVK